MTEGPRDPEGARLHNYDYQYNYSCDRVLTLVLGSPAHRSGRVRDWAIGAGRAVARHSYMRARYSYRRTVFLHMRTGLRPGRFPAPERPSPGT